MANKLTKQIKVNRGDNIGKTIIKALEEEQLYNKVDILTFDFKRDAQHRVINVTLTYKYNFKHIKTHEKSI